MIEIVYARCVRMAAGVSLAICVLASCGAASDTHFARYSDQDDAYTRAVRGRAEVTMSCSGGLVVEGVGGGGYIATGCGLTQSYTCAAERRGGHRVPICSPDDPPAAASSVARASAAPAPAPSVSPLAATDAQVARAALTACPEALASGAVVVTIAIGGDVQRVETPGVAADVATCIVQALRAAHFAASSVVRRGSVPAGPATPAAPSAPNPGEAPARAYVEVHRDVILACTGTTAAAVVASWTADGAITLALPDAQSGTSQDGCVRAAASGTLSPAPGMAGSVLHAVH